MKKQILCGLLMILITAYTVGQINYVFNGSFEILYGCPNDYNQIDSAVGWHILINGGGGNPEVYNACYPQSNGVGVPINVNNHGFQYPHSGNGYAGIDAGHSSEPDNLREYIQSQLIKKLKPGSLYCVTFYVSLIDHASASIKTLGAYFDDGSVSAPPYFGIANAFPQVYNSTIQLDDKVNWMKIEGSFIASGNEEYITIGNFFTDAESDIIIIGSPTSWWSYYYIDDVSVMAADLPAYAGKDTIVHNPGDSVFIGRHPEIGLNEDCIWFVNGVPIDTIAGMWVTPANTTAYILQQTICGNVEYDTITVTVSGVGVEHYLWKNKWLKVYPNPAEDEFYVEYSGDVTGQVMTTELYNIYGALVKEVHVSNKNKFTVSTREVPSGIYFYRVRLGNEVLGKDKIVIIK
jgi:hypothetical protein